MKTKQSKILNFIIRILVKKFDFDLLLLYNSNNKEIIIFDTENNYKKRQEKIDNIHIMLHEVSHINKLLIDTDKIVNKNNK